MANPQWTVSIIAQYTQSEQEPFVPICYDMLIKSIKAHRKQNINFYVLKYNRDNEVSEFFSYDFVTENDDRNEHLIRRKITKNFYNSPDVMIEFFKDFSLKSNAEHHFVITFGHGTGFGTFAEGYLQEIGEGLVSKEFPIAIQFYKRLFSSGVVPPEHNENKFIKVMSFLSENNLIPLNVKLREKLEGDFRIVTIESLALALSSTFGKVQKKVDFMYSMSCFMQMFETGYHLKDHVKFYAASETFQFFPGPDYDSLFGDLSAPGPFDLRKLSQSVIDNYNTKYSRQDMLDLLTKFSDSMAAVTTNIREVFLSIIAFELHQECADQINKVASLLLKKENRNKLYPIIRDVRERCTEVSRICFGIIDIAHFCSELLKENLQDDVLASELRKLIEIIRQPGHMIVARRCTPALCVPTRINDVMQSICPQGVSVFFPKDLGRTAMDQYVHHFMDTFYTPNETKPGNVFLQNSSWDDFVRDYFFYDSFPQ